MIRKKEILELETRRKIYLFLSENPGLHARRISRKLSIPRTTLNYHLHFLEKRDLITKYVKKNYTIYFCKEKVGRNDKKIISILQKDIPRNIILLLFIRIISTPNQIKTELDIIKHSGTITYHIKKLVKQGIIEQVNIKNKKFTNLADPPYAKYPTNSSEKLYRLKYPLKIYDLLITYKKELKDDCIIQFIFELMDYRKKYGYIRPGVYHRNSQLIDHIFDNLYEVFPHPYHL